MIKRVTMFQKATDRAQRLRLPLVLVWGWIAMAAASAGLAGAQQADVIDRIVAVVNSDIITLYDLNRAFKPYEDNIKALRYPPDKERQTLFQVRSDILDKLIESQLADQQIKREQISVTQKEIDTTIERMKEARSFTDEQLREGLAAQGITMEEYRKEIESQILRTKLVNREVKSKIVITQADIKAYYDSHQEKYAGEKKYYLWNLFIKASEADKDEALQKMKAIEQQLKQGESFEVLVKQLGESASAVQGTDLGLYRLDELSKQLQTVVEKLKAAEFSGVLDTNFGYQIIYVQKIMDTPAKPLEAVETEIQQLLYDEFVDNKYQVWLQDLRARSHIRIIN
jgi:peptidyl-prolyl cis-trans isomerase SurA